MSEQEIIDNWLNMRQQQPVQLATQEAYWQHYRIQASIQALGGLTSNPNFEQHTLEDVIAECVTLADALVAELKRSDDVYAKCRRMDAINTASVCENMTKIQKELQKKGGNDESNVH